MSNIVIAFTVVDTIAFAFPVSFTSHLGSLESKTPVCSVWSQIFSQLCSHHVSHIAVFPLNIRCHHVHTLLSFLLTLLSTFFTRFAFHVRIRPSLI